MKLSILIPSTFDRKVMTERLCKFLVHLSEPYKDQIEVVTYMDDRTMTIGEKRNEMYRNAKGEYSVQIDSDDMVSISYVDQVMSVLNSQSPDCITYMERCIMNGKLFSSNHSLKYKYWNENYDGFDYTRTPFMKDVIKTEIARSVSVKFLRYAEDIDWSLRLRNELKNEVHINDYLYYYEHESSDFKTRYGFDKDVVNY